MIETRIVGRESPMSGYHEMTLTATLDQWRRLERREELIQNVVPEWSPAEREFWKTGYTDADWQEMFGGEDDENDEDGGDPE